MSDLESDALKLSMAIDRAYIDALEAYFYECVEVPWVLMQKTSSDPYELIGYFKDEPSIQKAIQDLQTAIPDFKPAFESQRLPKTEWQNAYKAFVKPWNDRELHWIPLWARQQPPSARSSPCIYRCGHGFWYGLPRNHPTLCFTIGGFLSCTVPAWTRCR